MRVVNNHNNVASSRSSRESTSTREAAKNAKTPSRRPILISYSRLRVTDLLLQRAIRLELDRYAHYWSMQGHVKEKEILVVIDA